MIERGSVDPQVHSVRPGNTLNASPGDESRMAWASAAAAFAASTHHLARLHRDVDNPARVFLYRVVRSLRTAIED